MPTLADIYSAADSFKRRLADVASNPLTSAQQMLGYANDRARAQNERMAQAAQQSMETGEAITPEDRRMAIDLAQSYNPVGMTVWHGSPHVFERFDLGKMGTGEGNQSFGKGLYMAQAPETAKTYATDRSYVGRVMANVPDNTVWDASRIAKQAVDTQGDNALKHLEYVLKQNSKLKAPGQEIENQKISDAIELIKNNQIKPSGNLYKVDLPDTHVRRMLDWDAPLKDQPYPVRNLAKKLGMDMKDLGGDLIGKIGKGEEGRKILQDAGIPGIKYYDQMSRGDQTGTRNFVVFDPNHLTILERNNKPLQ